MMNIKLNTGALTAALLTAGLTLSAQAATVYNYGWETASVGAIDGNDNWSLDALNAGSVTTTTVTGMSGNVAESNTGIYTRANDGAFGYTIAASATEITMSVVVTATNDTTNNNMGLSNSVAGNAFRFGKHNATNWFFRNPDGSITDIGEAGAANLTSTRKSYKATVVIDTVNDTLDFFVDNLTDGGSVQLANDAAIQDVDWSQFDGLYVRSGAGNHSDNFTVTSVPEPSSAALLGLGGLALILRRRK